jgi:hypothetical protein
MWARGRRSGFSAATHAPAGGGGGGSFVAPTFIGVTALAPAGAGALTAYTFTGRDIGAADANRWIIVGVSEGGISDISGATYNVGGGPVSMGSPIVQNTRTNYVWCAFYCVNIPTGTTAEFVLSHPVSSGYNCGLAVYRMIRPGGAHGLVAGGVDNATSFTQRVSTVTIPSGGRGMWASMTDNSYGGGKDGFTGPGMVDDYSPDPTPHTFASSANVGSTTGTKSSGGGGSERVCCVSVASPGS